jgi:catechol 2,3-dioxygenase-like lactoylglutathione lyase family enzyme
MATPLTAPALRVQVVSVPVRDQDRAKAFYTDVLGFEVVTDAPFGEGQRWVEVRPPGSPTSFSLVTWFPEMPPGSLHGLVLATVDVRAAVAALRASGVAFHQEVEEAPWGTFTTFSDPDGNAFVLSQSA